MKNVMELPCFCAASTSHGSQILLLEVYRMEISVTIFTL